MLHDSSICWSVEIYIDFFSFLSDFSLAHKDREDEVEEWGKNANAIWTWVRCSDWTLTEFFALNSSEYSFTNN